MNCNNSLAKKAPKKAETENENKNKRQWERESEFDLEDEDKSVTLDEEAVKAEVVDEVDVDTNVPIPAFCSSDEDEEDKSALLYLPIAPEIEDPEENWVPGVDPSPTKDELSPHKRSMNNDAAKENTSPKKKRPKTTDILLENAPVDGKIKFRTFYLFKILLFSKFFKPLLALLI